jgi:hypothetical protein
MSNIKNCNVLTNEGHLLRTPVLNDTCKPNLFWIVSNVWSN